MAMTGRLQSWRAIKTIDSDVYEIFLTEFREEHFDHRLHSRRIESNIHLVVYYGIESSRQPVPLIFDLYHGLFDRKVIRVVAIKSNRHLIYNKYILYL